MILSEMSDCSDTHISYPQKITASCTDDGVLRLLDEMWEAQRWRHEGGESCGMRVTVALYERQHVAIMLA